MTEFYISAFADESAPSIEGQIDALRRGGLTHIELRNTEHSLVHLDNSQLEQLALRLKEAGITVSSYGSPIGKSDITEDFSAELERFDRALHICRIFDCNRMRIFSFFVPADRTAEYRDEVISRLKALVALASEAGVTLCHENEHGIYGQNPAEVADLAASVPGLRTIFDASNFIMDGCDIDEGWSASLPNLEYIHIKDAKRIEGGSPAILPVGEGDGRYAELLSNGGLPDRLICLTLEPHLYVSDSYSKIDPRKLRNIYRFDTPEAAFDCGLASLRRLLTSIGYTEGEDKIWRKN